MSVLDKKKAPWGSGHADIGNAMGCGQFLDLMSKDVRRKK